MVSGCDAHHEPSRSTARLSSSGTSRARSGRARPWRAQADADRRGHIQRGDGGPASRSGISRARV